MSSPQRKRSRPQKASRRPAGRPRAFPTMPGEVHRERQDDGSYLVACEIACPQCGCKDINLSRPLPEIECWDCGTVYKPLGDVELGSGMVVG